MRPIAALLLLLSLPLLHAQTPAQTPGQAPDITQTPTPATTRPAEPPVQGLTRTSDTALTFTPGTTPTPLPVQIHDFDFNGDPVPTSKLHLKQLAPGVVEITSVAYTVGYWRFSLADSPLGVYGLGERFDVLNHSHTIVRNTSQDNGGPKGSTTYKPMPFYMSTSGYGLWLDTTGEATFDLNASSRDDIIVDAVASHLRIILYTGQGTGRFPSILSDFSAMAGKVTLPPYWAFAPWQARDYHENQAQVLEDVDKTRALGLPASVILIDSPWTTAYNSYLFNPKQFDDAPGMVRHLHEQGYKLVLWHTSWINNKSKTPGERGFADKLAETSPNYAEAAQNGFFIRNPDGTPYVGTWWKGQGSLIDFTNPSAKAWWQDQVRLAIKAGADGFKNDDAEGNFQGPTANLKFADGSDPRLMRNRYDVLYNNAMEELIQKDLRGNGVLFARSVSAGANGIGMLWGGDNEASFSKDNGLPSVVTAGLGAGLSAMPLWASDTGGYLGLPDTPNTLLLQRWTEYSAFSPAMEVMSSKNIVPWTFDTNSPAGTTPAFDTYKKFVTLHMSLFPYRYAAAQQAAAAGQPIMRALVLNFQDDAKARAIHDEYLFGPDLLVAPITDENTSRPVYLPPGEWLNLFTGEPISGPRTLVAAAPADTIPVYARRGTILPKIPEDVMTLVPASESGNKTIHTLDNRRIFELLGPAADTPTTTIDFEARTLVRTGDSLTITGTAPAHIILRFRFQTPGTATINGTATPIQSDASGIATVEFDFNKPTTITWN